MNHSPQDMSRYVSEIKWLREEFEIRFQDFRNCSIYFPIIANPFGVNLSDIPEYLQIEVIELKYIAELKVAFCDVPLMTFYKQHLAPDDFPFLLKHAKMIACVFGSTYTCEQLFSLMKIAKTRSELI